MAAKQLPLITMRKTTLRLPEDLHRRLKIRAVQENRQMSDLLIDAVERYLSVSKGASRAGQ